MSSTTTDHLDATLSGGSLSGSPSGSLTGPRASSEQVVPRFPSPPEGNHLRALRASGSRRHGNRRDSLLREGAIGRKDGA